MEAFIQLICPTLDAFIFNPQTERSLIVNSGTTHLARVHHLLEKGNKYGMSAKDFYEHFMI